MEIIGGKMTAAEAMQVLKTAGKDGLLMPEPKPATLVDVGGKTIFNAAHDAALTEMGASDETKAKFYAAPKKVQEQFLARWEQNKVRLARLEADPKALERVRAAEAKRNKKKAKRAAAAAKQ